MNKECNSAQNNLTDNNMQQEELKGSYTISEIDNAKGNAEAITITFDAATNKVSGFSGCNRFFGTYKVEGNTITFSNIATTKKFCLDKENQVETKVLNAINNASSFKLKNNELTLMADSKVVLKTVKRSETKPKPKSKADMIGDHYATSSVTYIASARGFYEYVSVSEGDITISDNQSLKNRQTTKINTADWTLIKSMMDKLDSGIISSLKPPSTNHQVDGAPHANLTLRNGDLETTSPTFDHGNPPKEITPLVNKLLSLAEIAKKQ